MRTSANTITVRADKRLSFVDVTEDLYRAIKDSGVTTGIAAAFCRHTTCLLLINEWEDGVLADFCARLEALVPPDVHYAHDDMHRRRHDIGPDEPMNARAHVMQMLAGAASHAIPVGDGQPMLGRWQRLILLELDEPKERTIAFQVLGE